jgi:hypothetical protein
LELTQYARKSFESGVRYQFLKLVVIRSAAFEACQRVVVMFKLSSVALCCAMCGAVSIGTSVEAAAKKGSFTRAVGVGVGVGIAKQVMKPKRDRNGQSGSDDDDTTTSAAGMMIATPVANNGSARTQAPAATPSDPIDDGKVVCLAGCYK